MTTLNIHTQGAKVTRNGERIQVQYKGDDAAVKVDSYLVRDLTQLALFGAVQITTQAATLLMQHEVPVFLMGRHGGLVGKISKDGSKYAKMRHRQLQLVTSYGPQMRQIAVQLVRSKLRHQQGLLQTLSAQVAATKTGPLQSAVQHIENLRRDCGRSTSLDAVRGYEGRGSVLYFAAIRSLLDSRWEFTERAYFPPPDPFNAMLSLGYTMLRKDVETAVHLVGLDPYLGCLHEMADRKQALIYDLMEEFRPLIVDRAVLDLVFSGDVSPDEFTFTGNPKRPVHLGPKQLPLLNNAYEARASDIILHRPSQSQQQIRRCIELQTRIYARVVMGERQGYDGI